MSSQPRKAAPRIAQPAQRYWKGKAPKGAEEEESDSDEEAERSGDEPDEDMPLGGVEEEAASRRKEKPSMNVALKDVNINAAGKVIVAGKEESGRTLMEESEEETSEEEGGVEDEESGSSEEESESEDEPEEEKPKLQFRPVFVPKRGRATILEREAEDPESEDAIAKREQEAELRKKEAHELVAESIKRDLAQKDAEEIIPDVDDTDGIDPDAEFEAWRLRELGRIKRDKEVQVQRELEKEEIERRRAMPEEQRLKEDLERANKSRDEKPKGQQKFLQKYYHKGAFHQDADILKRHDYTEATTSTVDVSLLPKVMQVKDFGKRSRTKYTHLLDQDTTRDEKTGKGSNATVRKILSMAEKHREVMRLGRMPSWARRTQSDLEWGVDSLSKTDVRTTGRTEMKDDLRIAMETGETTTEIAAKRGVILNDGRGHAVREGDTTIGTEIGITTILGAGDHDLGLSNDMRRIRGDECIDFRLL